MTPLSEMDAIGKAQNPDANATGMDAQSMRNYFTKMFENSNCVVKGLFINTTVSGPIEAQMIPVEDVDPAPSLNDTYYYQLQVESPTFSNYWHVQSWVNAIRSRGLEQATRDYMLQINPVFMYLDQPDTNKAINDTLAKMHKAATPEVPTPVKSEVHAAPHKTK